MSSDALPLEVFQKVLSYLGPEDLSTCCCVCKKWRAAINYDPIWKRIARLYSVYPDFVTVSSEPDTQLGEECRWKKISTEFLGRVRSGWKEERCTTLDASKSGAIIDKTTCDGRTLVVSYINGFIEIFDLVAMALIQTIDIPISGHETVAVATDTDYVVMAKSNVAHAYKRSDKGYTEHGVAAVKDGTLVWSQNSNIAESMYRRGGASATFISCGILWLIDRLRGDISLVDLSTQTVLDPPSMNPADDWLLLNGRVSARCGAQLLVFQSSGSLAFRLTRDRAVQVRHADASPTMIAAVVVLMDDRNMWKEVSLWDSGNGQLLKAFSVLEDCVVRASLSHVLVVRFGYKDCAVTAHSLNKTEAIWKIFFQYSNSATVHDAKGSFYPITNRYVVALPSRKGQSLMYLENGEPLGNSSSLYMNKFNHFFSHVVVSYSCTIDGVFMSIRSYV